MYFIDDPGIDAKKLKSFGGKAFNLNRLFLAGFPVPKGFVLTEPRPNLEEAISKIGGFPVAVRSSGSLEDLPNASFAGLYETFLYVKTFEELYSTIQLCFDSKNSHRVQDYLKTKKIEYSDENLSMSVLVQKMVDPKMAGVLFTLNPTNGKEEEMYIEYCQGVGERLVSGHVTPSTMTYNWMENKILSDSINNEKTEMTSPMVANLVEHAVAIQEYYGKPQDIEWAIDHEDKLYILQSRPITTFVARDDTPELTNADFKDGGVSARVCTPLMYSLYREALKDSMGSYFKKISLLPHTENIIWIYYHYGRVYWNAGAVKEGLKKVPGYREDVFDQDLGIQKDYGASGPARTKFNFTTIVNAIPVLIGLNKEFVDCKNMIRLFRDRFETKDSELKSMIKQFKKMTDQEFNSWFLDVILFQLETEKNYFRTIYNNSNFQTEYKSFIKKLAAYEDGDEIDLMSDLHGVSHLDVQAGLKKLRLVADFYGFDSRKYYSERENFLKYHYHHGPAELDITVPRWGERKEWVDDLVNQYAENDKSRIESIFRKTSSRYLNKISTFKKASFIKKTDESREFLRLREEVRAFSTRAYYLVRLGTLEFGKRNSISEDDVFFYDIKEIRSKIIDSSYSLPDIAKRKQFYKGYRDFRAPNEFGGSIQQTVPDLGSNTLKGLGCSAGELTGIAKVITNIHQTSGLTKDDILVTIFTDPGWTPVLGRVGGVITEVGGLLSHAAVIGREYQIPAILNLVNATTLIQNGDRIRMNGKTGIVEILEKAPNR